MKFVVYGLILSNMLMLGWLYQHRDVYRASPLPATQLPASIEPLVLLRERGAVPPAPPAEPPAEPPEQTALPSTPAPVVEAVDGATTDPLPPAPTPTPETAMPATEAMPPRICQSIGPFAERQAADAFIAELSGLGPTAAVRTAHIEQPSGYWVYLPSMPLAQAQIIVSDFESKGVKDYFLGRQNFISLGVFADKRSAEARSQAIMALGYAPKLEPRFLSREVYWVDVEETSNAPVNAEQWAGLLANRVDIRRQPLTCE